MKLLLIRGLPGSGKSTLAGNLIGFYYHVETDKFWMDKGEYKFDHSRLTEAHEWCLDQTRNLMNNGFSPVVSNTFTIKRNMRPYFELAQEFGIVPTVIHCQNDFGNIHNVPQDVLDRMRNQFEYDISDLFDEYKIL
jgi:predicted kinase